MKNRTVVLTRTARNQILAQVEYIAESSRANALAWEEQLLTAVRGLGTTAGYPIDQDASDRIGIVVHKMVFEGTYLIHYRIDQQASIVQVVNVRHGARMPQREEP